MEDFTSSAGIAGTAILIANLVVWALGGAWTPQRKALVGALSALGVFLLGVVLFPQAWADGATAFSVLFQALLVVLAAAGAPVFRDVIRGGGDDKVTPLSTAGWQGDKVTRTPVGYDRDTDGQGRTRRRWVGWNR